MNRAVITMALACSLCATMTVRAGTPSPPPSGQIMSSSFMQSGITANSVTGVLDAQVQVFSPSMFDTFDLGIAFSSTDGLTPPSPVNLVVFNFVQMEGECDTYTEAAPSLLCGINRPFTFTGANPVGSTFFATLTLMSDNVSANITGSPQSPQFTAQAGAVPEPVTLALLGAGLAGLALSRRRNRA